MARYIDAYAIPYRCKNAYLGGYAMQSDIDAIPTADVQEIVHGKWIEETEQIKSIAMMPTFVKYYRCSICGRKEHNKEPYCNCGAKMDKE